MGYKAERAPRGALLVRPLSRLTGTAPRRPNAADEPLIVGFDGTTGDPGTQCKVSSQELAGPHPSSGFAPPSIGRGHGPGGRPASPAPGRWGEPVPLREEDTMTVLLLVLVAIAAHEAAIYWEHHHAR